MNPEFIKQLGKMLDKQQIVIDELLRYAYSTDASMYRMVPQLVLLVHNESEVRKVIQLAARYNIKLTFRAAGTSLSGQAVTDQVLVVLRHDSWRKYAISAQGDKICLQPGVIGSDANGWLAKIGRQIGPDPASINTAKIGGIIANNSSGMCCGTAKNSYATLVDLRAIFANGALLDSENKASINNFYQTNPELINGIIRLRDEINSDEQLKQFIRKKFSIKNTSGYSLNAFLDYSDPIKIIERLLVGSEGTLGFVSQVTLETLPVARYKAVNLIFATIDEIIRLTVALADVAVSAIELLDSVSLKSVAHIRDLQPYLIEIRDETCAIMLEISAESEKQLAALADSAQQQIDSAQIIHQSGFVSDSAAMTTLWKARKGVLPTVAGNRPLGSTVLIEDVAVPLDKLAALIKELQEIFGRYGYSNAAIFGHVLAGNIHFVLTPNFNIPQELSNYDRFMHELAVVVGEKYQGSLKAEHGSGRNISPFAAVEWGERCIDIMWEIKQLFDPQGIFNPDVKLTRDNTLHLKYLKDLPLVDETIDKCMECGFCEPVCPSRNLSLTPRQRNAVARKISTLSGEEKKRWEKKFAYYGVTTCAATGMCQTVCPVEINTGDYMRRLRKPQLSRHSHVEYIQQAKSQLGLGNRIASVIGPEILAGLTSNLQRVIPLIPSYPETMPQVQHGQFTVQPNSSPITQELVWLLPSCPQRIFKPRAGISNYPTLELISKMGFSAQILPRYQESCCGQIYHSCGDETAQATVQNVLRESIPVGAVVVSDNSSCAGFAADSNLAIGDINQFLAQHSERLSIDKKFRKIAVHVDCSSAKHGFNNGYVEILKRCADEVVFPEGIKCCGFAGDKGFSVPELNASSLAGLRAQISDCEMGVTFNRNCQIGLEKHSGIEYISLVELVLECWQNQ